MPEDMTEKAIKIIERNIFHLQQELNKKLHMKIVPKLIFEIDQAEIKAQRIEKILGKIKKG